MSGPMTPVGSLLATLPSLLHGWPGATPADWSRAAADGLESALRLSDATGRYVRDLSLALGVHAPDRVALVAGAHGAISKALRTQLAASGLRVLSVEPPAPPGPGPASAPLDADVLALDPRDAQACRDAARDIEHRHGHVEVLIHVVEADDVEPDDVAARLESVYHLSKCVIDGMSARAFGRIVLVCVAPASAAQGTGYRDQKTAVLAFGRSLAREVAARGITVNVVSPGPLCPPDTATAPAGPELLDRIPAGRLATPADVAHVVGFLAGAGAGYVTGADIPVSGGLRL